MTIPSPTKNTVRLLIGPPGAGKSTYAQEKLTSKPLKKYVVIDPDDFKPRVRAQFKESGFPYAESEIHEHSIQIALQVYELALREDFDKKIIFSGTGSWLPYMEHLIFLAKQSERPVKLIMVTASLEICQLRCKNRPDDPATRQEDSGRLIPNAALTEEQLQLIVSNFKKLQPKSIGWKILSTQTGTLVVQEKSPQDPCRVISNPS